MKYRHLKIVLVLCCSYAAPQALLAADCSTVRSDIQSIQAQMRQVEMNRANSGFDAIVAVSRLVKGSCLDTLSALDMSTFGFTPGASALVTKLASQACQRLTSELSQKVNDVNSKISQGINDVEGRVNNGIGDVTGGMLGSSGGFGPDTSIGPGGSTSPLGVVKDAVGNAWDKMKNLLTR